MHDLFKSRDIWQSKLTLKAADLIACGL